MERRTTRYAIPAADDFGVVYAVTAGGYGDIVRMDHSGNRIGAPFRPEQALAAIDAIRPSPNGQILTYTSVQFTVNPDGSGGNLIFPVFFVNFAYADGSDSSAIEHRLDGGYAAWYGEDRVVFDPVTASDAIDEYDTYVLGEAAPQNWFATCDDDDPFPPACNVVGGMDVSRGLERMAAIRYNNEFTDEPAGIVAYALNGAPPAQPARICTFEASTAAASILNVAWSPDGDSLLWDYTATTGQPAPAGAGIYLANGFETGTCGAAFASGRLVVAGASQPYWSAATFGMSAPGTSSEYVPLQPERLLDTRAESGPLGYAGAKPAAGTVVEVDVTGAGSSNVPDSALAVVLNVTGVDPSAAGFVTVWPCGQPRPTASNLNLAVGQVAPNLTITKVGANGRVCLFTQTGTHLIADIAGYFPAGT